MTSVDSPPHRTAPPLCANDNTGRANAICKHFVSMRRVAMDEWDPSRVRRWRLAGIAAFRTRRTVERADDEEERHV